jgi:hypothetical protein
MNPNLRIFFKRSLYFIGFAALVAALFYGIKNFTPVDLSDIGGYIANGFVGLMVIGMTVLITGIVFRSVWTGIMNRVDTIVLCCPDKKYDGVHIVASHYNPGGESTEGFSNYFHYYLDQNGKLYLSKRVENDGREIRKSIQHLSEQTRLQLEPDPARATDVGSYTHDENKATKVTMPLRQGELHFRGYEGWVDYGFKVTYMVGSQTKWRVTI